MKNLTKRRLAVVGGILILAAGVGGMMYLSSLKEAPPRKPKVVSVKQVEVIDAQPGPVSTTLQVQGELVAYDKIDLFSEVSGTLEGTSRSFKVGTYFPKGSPMIRIDDAEARLNLMAQKSTLLNGIAQILPDLKIDYSESFPQWEAYLTVFNPEEAIQALPEPQSEQEKLFVASRNLYTQYYSIKSLEERLSKYTIYAPFSGVLTNSSIHPGAVVRVGQKLGELMGTGNYELVATVPLSELKYLQQGSAVNLISEDIRGTWSGKVKRISDQIDASSQTVQVFIGVQGKDLREGMYLEGYVKSGAVPDALEIDRALLVDQRAVYAVADSVLELQPVEVLKYNRNTVVITGLPAGTPIVSQPVPGAFEGMRVKVVESTSQGSDTQAAPKTKSSSEITSLNQ